MVPPKVREGLRPPLFSVVTAAWAVRLDPDVRLSGGDDAAQLTAVRAVRALPDRPAPYAREVRFGQWADPEIGGASLGALGGDAFHHGDLPSFRCVVGDARRELELTRSSDAP